MMVPPKLDICVRFPSNMPPIHIPIAQLPAQIAALAKGGRVFMPSGPVEPLSLLDAYGDDPQAADDITFLCLSLPGINTSDWSALHARAYAEIFLPTLDRAESIANGKTRVLPVHYSAAYRYLSSVDVKVAIFHVCPPDGEGFCNLSLSADACPAFIDRDLIKIGIINPLLPTILGAPKVGFSMFHFVAEAPLNPLCFEPTTVNSKVSAIATQVARLVDDGATIQAGIGKLPGAVMSALKGHKNLRLHSGLIGDWALDLSESGAWADGSQTLTAGVVLGSTALQTSLCDDPRLRLCSISKTHGAGQLGQLKQFTSINAALEIDLFGQINCEFAGDRTISGVGGAVDFLRGARASNGGKPIIMIQSQGKNGVSRIVPHLQTPCISIARTDAPILVTEHGAIDLEPLDTQARARAIISLADPLHHQSLSEAWKRIGGKR